ncbi:MAG: alpha amylase N-terminal ig-like domain-containing protein [Fimbriimonadaceae bacterium]|nr:alpha amylase N-terminal ig-like domain-containing protein [Fimbriimonadaceae bacterium]QYK56157.1 MAG: alpha amylase N-terminal ig-like domain-containing protein [Fimbriimonadaceae bacterium]
MLIIASALLMSSMREVSFSYKPKTELVSVAVAGEFNNWDRGRNPLAKGADGVWRGTVEIAPGVYQYRFVEDGKRWVPDPSAPAVLDSNGNTNSMLVVVPPFFDGQPGVVGDGFVTMEALAHSPDARDVVRRDAALWRFRLRTRHADVQSVSVVLDGGGTAKLQVTESDQLYDYWEGDAATSAETVGYRFQVTDGPSETLWPEGEGFKIDAKGWPLPNVPKWVGRTVFYQIFPERFENGRSDNDPERLEPWGSTKNLRGDFGGDLAGVARRLGHLHELGVNALYLNPVFEAGSYHAYDTVDYYKITERFGDEDDFKALTARLKAIGIRLVLDGVFNHSSPDFFAFKDLREKGEGSAYRDWYTVHRFPVEVKEGQQTYATFAGVSSMPKLRGDNPEVQEYFAKVGVYWIKDMGADGWRLDVADEVDEGFWRRFRAAVRGANPDAFLLGEVWGDARRFLRGDEFDSVMNYRWRRIVLDGVVEDRITPKEMGLRLASLRDSYPKGVEHAMFNLLGSHDTPRIKTVAKGDMDKVRQLAMLQFTYPGVPSIYYGDEVGMEGGADPDCRRTMDWTKRTWDVRLFTFYQDLVKLRLGVRALQEGQYRLLAADDRTGLFAFERRGRDESAVTVLNLAPAKRRVEVSFAANGLLASLANKATARLRAGAEGSIASAATAEIDLEKGGCATLVFKPLIGFDLAKQFGPKKKAPSDRSRHPIDP